MKWRRGPRSRGSIADRLVIPEPFDLDVFCEGISSQRGRPLLLLPLDGPVHEDTPCGAWLSLDVADLVFYEANTSGVHRVQIVLHEIAHMLLGHVVPEFATTGNDDSDRTGAHLQALLAHANGALAAMDQSHPPIADIIRGQVALLREAASTPTATDRELGVAVDRIVRLLSRTRYTSRQEMDAETLATLILERASRNETRSTSEKATDALSRLNDAFGHPVRNQ